MISLRGFPFQFLPDSVSNQIRYVDVEAFFNSFFHFLFQSSWNSCGNYYVLHCGSQPLNGCVNLEKNLLTKNRGSKPEMSFFLSPVKTFEKLALFYSSIHNGLMASLYGQLLDFLHKHLNKIIVLGNSRAYIDFSDPYAKFHKIYKKTIPFS